MIPIFIICYERLHVLKQTVQSIRKCCSRYKLVFSDNASTYKPLLNYYDTIEKAGAIVYRNKTNDPFGNIAKNLRAYKTRFGIPKNYVVTDPDIQLQAKSDVLELFQHVLAKHSNIRAVGPMLRIDDIPNTYPLKKMVLERHRKIWNLPKFTLAWKGSRVRFVRFKIDSTFAMYRGAFNWQRLQPSFRMLQPYAARHLDWYVTVKNMTADQKLYLRRANRLSHWSGSWLRTHIQRSRSRSRKPSRPPPRKPRRKVPIRRRRTKKSRIIGRPRRK